jgi:hypothetical protein
MSKTETTNSNDFWRRLPYVLQEAEQTADDEDAAAMLIEFLEQHHWMFPRIASTLRLTGTKRTLIQRACAILAVRDDVDDSIPC